MKRIFFLLLVFVLIAVFFGGAFVLAYPWQYYKKEQALHAKILRPKDQLRLEMDQVQQDEYLNRGLLTWKSLHFQNFDLIFPLKNPEIYFLPTPKWIDGKNILAGEYYHRNHKKMLSFQIRTVTTLKFDHFGQKFFREVPYAREILKKKTEEDIWKDLLKRDLKIEIPENWLALEAISTHWDLWHQVGGRELVYRYYLMMVRDQLLKDTGAEDFVASSDQTFLVFDKKETQGLAEGLRRETMAFYLNQKLYSLELVSDFEDKDAQKLREVFLRNFHFNLSDENETISLYAQFKNLSYDLKIDAAGLVYLYSAWSHSVNNKKILEEIIFYQEKNKNNFEFLNPFYEYTKKRYGNTLSDQVTEFDDAETKLNKKIGNEMQQDKKEMSEAEVDRLTPVQKTEHFIEKAKKDKNTDSSEKVLVE